jgi:hypothetical protein
MTDAERASTKQKPVWAGPQVTNAVPVYSPDRRYLRLSHRWNRRNYAVGTATFGPRCLLRE